MAVKPFAFEEDEGHTIRVSWTLDTGDTGQPYSAPGAQDKAAQVIGTMNSTTITMQGSLQKTSPDKFGALSDGQGNDCVLSTDGQVELAVEPVKWVRPSSAGGTGTGLIVTMFFKSGMR